MFDIGDKVKHQNDPNPEHPLIGTVLAPCDNLGYYQVSWKQYGIHEYTSKVLVLVTQSGYSDFLDKVKDRLGD